MKRNILGKNNQKYLKNLMEIDYEHSHVSERLLSAVSEIKEKERSYLPDVIGKEKEVRKVLSNLIQDEPVMLIGEYGVGKTFLVTSLMDTLKDYSENEKIYRPKDCPVNENPLNLIEKYNEICPICKSRYKDKNPDEIPVETVNPNLTKVTPDATPEELVGFYDVKKLSEGYSPLDPEVFEQGKIGLASSGIIFANELGKWEIKSQDTLLEVASEKTMTPAKCEGTFPVDMLVIGDTNPDEEYNIDEAIKDRFTNVKIDYPESLEEEVEIVKANVDSNGYLENKDLEEMIEIVRKTREYGDIPNVGTRGSIKAVKTSIGSTMLDKRDRISYCDKRFGIESGILGELNHEIGEDKRVRMKLEEWVKEVVDDKNET